MKKIVKIPLITIAVIGVLAVCTLYFGTRGMDVVAAYSLPGIDLSAIDDGTYAGSFDKTRWAMSVSVTVADHRIQQITITDRKSSNITESIITQVNDGLLNTPSPRLDAVSGATMTSKGYLIAVADALTF